MSISKIQMISVGLPLCILVSISTSAWGQTSVSRNPSDSLVQSHITIPGVSVQGSKLILTDKSGWVQDGSSVSKGSDVYLDLEADKELKETGVLRLVQARRNEKTNFMTATTTTFANGGVRTSTTCYGSSNLKEDTTCTTASRRYCDLINGRLNPSSAVEKQNLEKDLAAMGFKNKQDLIIEVGALGQKCVALGNFFSSKLSSDGLNASVMNQRDDIMAQDIQAISSKLSKLPIYKGFMSGLSLKPDKVAGTNEDLELKLRKLKDSNQKTRNDFLAMSSLIEDCATITFANLDPSPSNSGSSPKAAR